MTIEGWDALEWVRRNAIRLMSDAELLRSRSRHPSAVHLSILTMEECIKFCMVYFELTNKSKLPESKKHHADKFEHSAIFQMEKFVKALGEIGTKALPKWKEKVASGETEFTLEDIEFAERGAKAMNQTLKADKLIDLYFGALTDLFESIPELKERISAPPKIMNKVRLMSVYADVDENGQLDNVPMFFSDELSQMYVEGAKKCVKFIESVELPGSDEE